MATHNIGKFKIKTGEGGIAFRFGDGKIYRLGRKRGEAEPDYNEYNEEYMDGGEYEQDDYVPGDDYIPGGYSGRFAQSSGGADDFDDYEEDYDDRYEDDYDDRYQDDFESGYADDDYYDDGYGSEGDYDDRYLDEDAEGYGDDEYAGESPLIRYVDENDWVTYLLLVLLPPLGIYLLWRRRRFELPIRWGVSAASAIWFIILVILLISLIFSGSGDTTTAPPIEMTTPTPTVAVEATADPLADDELKINSLGDLVSEEGMDSLGDFSSATAVPGSAQNQDFLGIEPTATPIAGGSAPAAPGASGAMSGDTVIITSTGAYYHNNIACTNLEPGASTSNVTKEVAEQRSKVACPVCYPNQKTYYATATGTYYHVDIACSNMQGAAPITEEAAKNQGKTECPVCILHAVNTLDSSGLKFASASTEDESDMTVYATQGGRYFHVNATCSGMENATAGGLLNAMLAGKTACPNCCPTADNMVWCTKGGERYHNTSDCDGMQNAYQVTLAEAMILGKDRCSKCWGSSSAASVGTDSSASSGTDSIYVYGTKNGKYYHTDSDCSGMSGASRYTLKSMISSGRAACPTCCSGADTVVYATENGQYYHSYSTCSDMRGAQAGTLAQALAYGKQKCPECWAGSDSSGSDAVVGETASGSYVYCTKNGTYYHTKSNCSGMSGASKVQISAAVKDGKTACPNCAPAANYKVYSTSGGSYYHRTSSCSGMSGASQRTIEDAIVMGQSACPVCITSYLKANSSSSVSNVVSGNISSGGSAVSNVATGSFSTGSNSDNNADKPTSSGKYSSGKSGIKVYATATSKHYHTTSSCSGMTNASHVTLETALNYGKTACSKCASSANTSVYAVKNGKYYHYSKSCAGSGAVSGKRAEALALGFDACPYCVTKTETVAPVTETYEPGTSGLKVYASVSGKYYHASKSCAGSGASKVTLETALNYGKKPCSSCASSASKKVYSSASDKYYHSSKTCAGIESVSGSFAKALALGKKECPNCIGGSEAYEQSDIEYSAPADTNVYIDLDGNMLYYHKNSRCEDAGVSGATKVELEFVVSWGFKACPYCCPPTSVD